MTKQPVRHADTIIFPASLDPKAVSIVERLTENGFESYLVGGCVRDLMLGHIPKDFDVSTAARPRQMRRLFRNCRIIGRRFKLAHVHFGDHIIEVATFRRNPSEKLADGEEASGDEDLLITRDNEFGNAEEDTVRRDFTINALLYDVGTGEVIDYVGGVADLETRTLRTIGEANVRIAEDPVRMLRAIKFASRLDLHFDDELEQAMHDSADLISRSAPPRVLEEIFKLLTCGRSEKSLAMLYDYGLLGRLLPEIAEAWDGHRDELVATGRALDAIDQGQRKLSNAFVLSALWHRPWRAAYDAAVEDGDDPDPMELAADMIQPAALRMNIPRRDVGQMKALLTLQLRLERTRRGRRFRMNEFLARRATQEAIDFMYVRDMAGEDLSELHLRWIERLVERYGEEELAPSRPRVHTPSDDEDEDRPRRSKRRRRRRRGGRDRRGGDAEASSSDETGERAARPDRDEASSPSRATRSPSRSSGSEEKGVETETAAATPSDASPPATAGDRGESTDEATDRPSGQGAETPAGLRGFVGRFMRKVLGEKGAPALPGTHAEVSETRPGTATPPDAEQPPEAPQDETTAEASPPQPFGPVQGEANQQEDEDLRPRRRRRRRRRSRSRRSEGDTGEPQAKREGAEGDAAEDRDGRKSGDARAKESAADGKPRRKRQRRRGGRSGSGGDEKSTSGGGEGRRNGSGRGSKRSSRRGGSGEGGGSGSRSSGKGSGKSRDSAPKPAVEETGPGQRHPEDVEDIFDW